MKNSNSFLIKEYELRIENTLLKLLISLPFDNTTNKEPLAFATHTHNSTELFACEYGEINIKTKSEFFTLKSGDFAFIPPGIQHIKHSATDNSKFYVLNFSGVRFANRDAVDLYSTFLPLFANNKIIIIRNQPTQFIIIKKIFEAVNSNDEILPSLLLTQFLNKSIKMPFETIEENKITNRNDNKNNIKREYELDHLIARYYNKKISSADIAEQLHLCVRHLDRISKKRYGKTIHKVIIEKRLQAAQTLLETSDMTVEQIALLVGFNSSAGLYREFHKQFGLTPTEYRKKTIV